MIVRSMADNGQTRQTKHEQFAHQMRQPAAAGWVVAGRDRMMLWPRLRHVSRVLLVLELVLLLLRVLVPVMLPLVRLLVVPVPVVLVVMPAVLLMLQLVLLMLQLVLRLVLRLALPLRLRLLGLRFRLLPAGGVAFLALSLRLRLPRFLRPQRLAQHCRRHHDQRQARESSQLGWI